MISASKIRANRTNARASTGPKTAKGRARSAQNAFRHGLSLPVHADPVLSEEVEILASEIAGPGASGEIEDLARHVAEAQVELRRVRYARHQLLSEKMSDPYYERRADTRKKLTLLARVLRSLLGRNPPDIPMQALETYLLSTPQGPHKFATILWQEAKVLLAMDRYEQRALSRRKFAIRALDEARRRSPTCCNNW